MQLVCKRYFKVAYAHTGPKDALFTRLRCKQWSCAACAKTNQWIWRNWLIKRLPEVSDEWWLLTLTANENKRTAWGSMDNIRKVVDTLMKRVKRLFGEIEYARVYEKHPTSEAVHLHIIICGLSPYVVIGYSAKLKPMAIACISRTARDGTWSIKTWFKNTSRALGMGYIADIKRLEGTPETAAFYVTKYLTKAQEELHVKGLRHVQVTRGIGSPVSYGDEVWQTASYIVPRMFAPNAVVKDINTGATIDNAYWEIHDFYPYDD
jgi:hypothetical protein